MFKVIVLIFSIGLVFGASVPKFEDANAEILTYEYKVLDDGYSFEYSTSNGIRRRETGHLKTIINKDTKEPEEIMEVVGAYSYTGDDGKLYQVTYKSDENGYVPQVSSFKSAKPVEKKEVRIVPRQNSIISNRWKQ